MAATSKKKLYSLKVSLLEWLQKNVLFLLCGAGSSKTIIVVCWLCTLHESSSRQQPPQTAAAERKLAVNKWILLFAFKARETRRLFYTFLLHGLINVRVAGLSSKKVWQLRQFFFFLSFARFVSLSLIGVLIDSETKKKIQIQSQISQATRLHCARARSVLFWLSQ